MRNSNIVASVVLFFAVGCSSNGQKSASLSDEKQNNSSLIDNTIKFFLKNHINSVSKLLLSSGDDVLTGKDLNGKPCSVQVKKETFDGQEDMGLYASLEWNLGDVVANRRQDPMSLSVAHFPKRLVAKSGGGILGDVFGTGSTSREESQFILGKNDKIVKIKHTYPGISKDVYECTLED